MRQPIRKGGRTNTLLVTLTPSASQCWDQAHPLLIKPPQDRESYENITYAKYRETLPLEQRVRDDRSWLCLPAGADPHHLTESTIHRAKAGSYLLSEISALRGPEALSAITQDEGVRLDSPTCRSSFQIVRRSGPSSRRLDRVGAGRNSSDNFCNRSGCRERFSEDHWTERRC